MSLDVYLMVTQPVSVYDANITHNLGVMAANVKFNHNLTLYDVLWCPDEHGFQYAKDIEDYLDRGWNILMSEPEFYKTFNPKNGWGDYESLCKFVYEYRNACWNNPDAELSISK